MNKKPWLPKPEIKKPKIAAGHKIIVDLDGVMFNSKKFKRDLFEFVSKHAGDPVKKINSFYEKNRPLHYEKFFQNFFKPDYRAQIAAFEKKHRVANYLFPGVHKKLRALSRNADLILLTHGHKSWQLRKIKEGLLDKHFEKIIITSDHTKHKDLSRLSKKHKILHVIDDSRLVSSKARALGLRVKSRL